MNLISTDTIWSVEPTRFAAWLDGLAKLGAPPPHSILKARWGADERPVRHADSPPGVAVLDIVGVLTKSGDPWGEGTSTAAATRAVQAAAADADVKTIVLRIDSPGGSVDGLVELVDAVAAARRAKPVIAQVDGLAASAAYMVASQAGGIFAGRSDLVGSIGTRMLLYDVSRLLENAGIKPVAIDTGEYKSLGAPGLPITDNHKAYLRTIVNAYMRDFREAVMDGRNMPPRSFDAVADGRVFMALDAVKAGLVDGVRTFEQTMASLMPAGVPRAGAARIVSEEPIMANPNEAAPAPAQPPVAATLEELKALPGATSEFVLESFEQQRTVAQAAVALLQRAQKPAAGPAPGGPGFTAGGGASPVTGPTPFAQAQELARERRIPLLTAMQILVRQHPEWADDLLNGT